MLGCLTAIAGRPGFLLALLLVLFLLPGCQDEEGQPQPTPERPVALPSDTPTSVATPIATPPPVTDPLRDDLVNLAHLQRLTEVVEWDGVPVALVHIYSEAPSYNWVDAAGEGLAAVDDVARAALIYLAYYERTGDDRALELARACLNFTMALQAEDGQYYNFVLDREGTINREGITSQKEWGWWAARAQWALAVGYRVLKDAEPDYAATLQAAYQRGEAALKAALGPVGAFNDLHGVPVPAWFIGGGSDVTALAVISLAEYYAVEPNTQTQQLMTSLATAVAKYQAGGPGVFPYAAQSSAAFSPAFWHAWGSHQVHALALAGRLLQRDDWIEAARQTADVFFTRLLVTDLVNEMAPIPRRQGQIAYGTSVMTAGLWQLYQATGEEKYARYAGLTAAWLFGNNMAGIAMYDPESGRAFDGIDGTNEFRVNRNSGAESTIEALYALLLVYQDPLASQYLRHRPVEPSPLVIVEVENGTKVAGNATYGQQDWTGEAHFSNSHYYGFKAGDAVSLTVSVPETGDYWLEVAHLRRASPKPEQIAEAARAGGIVTIDGALEEWGNAQPLPVASREQVLRGAAAWPGAEEASFTLRWLWDDQNLYVAADVRDPEYVQNDTGPSVWRGDVLWLYLDTRGSRERVDVKLTLAQTPDGPQIWNWVGQSFLARAELAWQPTEGGYILEAALPLESLNFLEAEADKRIAFEAGLGFVGGFIDWTGLDPDTAANLAPLQFVDELSPAAQGTEVTEQAPQDVAFAVALPDGPSTVIPQAVSPDRDYLWLEPLFGEPVSLPAGQATLLISYAGQQEDREAVVDAVMILPRVACRQFAGDEGATLRLCYEMQTAAVTWDETP